MVRPGTSAAPTWRVLLRPRWISWHLVALAAVIGMLWLGDWQFRRAVGGNPLSWAYTVEWPVFAVFGVVFWVKTVRDELRPAGGRPVEEIQLPAGAEPVARQGPGAGPDGSAPAAGELQGDEPQDVELAEYNAYLARLGSEVRGHGKWHGLR